MPIPPAHLQRFRDHLTAQGLKFTRQREAIVEAFYDSPDHPGLPDLLERSKRLQASIGYATVYRTMKLLTESGLATEHKFGESAHVRYEPTEHGHHHDHLICKTCGHIFEFESEEIEAFQEKLAARNGLRVVWHRHEIHGECTVVDCVRRKAAPH